MELLEKLIVYLGLGCCIVFTLWVWVGMEKTHYYNVNEAKKILLEQVFHDMPVTLYCQAGFDKAKKIYPLSGFQNSDGRRGDEKLVWEHVVPVSRFGMLFPEWNNGHPECVSNGIAYKGRKCAAKINDEFVKMEGDMYNIFPAISLVNAARGAREFGELPDERSAFGSCRVRLAAKTMEPPDNAKGIVARASLYMADAHDRLKWSDSQQNLFEAWNRSFPVDKMECVRSKRIELLQGNENKYVKDACIAAGLW